MAGWWLKGDESFRAQKHDSQQQAYQLEQEMARPHLLQQEQNKESKSETVEAFKSSKPPSHHSYGFPPNRLSLIKASLSSIIKLGMQRSNAQPYGVISHWKKVTLGWFLPKVRRHSLSRWRGHSGSCIRQLVTQYYHSRSRVSWILVLVLPGTAPTDILRSVSPRWS